MGTAERFTVSMDGRLLAEFDKRNTRRGYANRSEAIRDLIRGSLVEDEWTSGSVKVAATVTLVYNHHTHALSHRLNDVQHHHADLIVSTTHVHLDNDNCLEVIILRGQAKQVRQTAEELCALKGVKHGKIALTTEGKEIV